MSEVQGDEPVQKAQHVSDPSDAAWYLVMPQIGYAKQWQGEPLAAPPVEDSDKAKLGELLGDFVDNFLDEMTGAGALRFSSLWCGGPIRALLVPKTLAWLEVITEKKRQFHNLEQTVREFAPEHYAELASHWQRLRPTGHILVIEGQSVYLPGEQAEMQTEAEEIFRDAYAHSALRPALTEITEPSEDDPDRWCVIIGWLKLAGLDGFWCAERDGLNSCAEEASLTGTPEAEAPDRKRAQVLVNIQQGAVPELSTGAWFDLEDVRRAWAHEINTRGEWHERFTNVSRLGSHLNFLWCNVPIGIKGPYFLPRDTGIVSRLSEGRRTYREAIAEKAKELGVEVRSLMLICEVRSPWLGQDDSDEPERLQHWFAQAKRGVSPLCELYWEDPWGGTGPLARILHPGQYPQFVCDGRWLQESSTGGHEGTSPD